MENAAPHSTVGKVAGYKAAALSFQEANTKAKNLAEQAEKDPENQDLQAQAEVAKQEAIEAHNIAAEALAKASNKEVDHAVAKAVNGILGIE